MALIRTTGNALGAVYVKDASARLMWIKLINTTPMGAIVPHIINECVGLSVRGERHKTARSFSGSSRRQDSNRPYPLIRANEALADLRSGRLQGAMVLVP